MEGLQINVVTYSTLYKNNTIFRIDAAFFDKSSYELELKIQSINHTYLKKNNVVSGPFGSSLKSESYLQTGIPFIRIENIKGRYTIDKNKMVYISPEDNEKLSNSILHTDDIIMSKVGNTIGFFARS